MARSRPLPSIRNRKGSAGLRSAPLRFPRFPASLPRATSARRFRLDFSVEPPKLGPPFPTLVPQVNLDGNETSGIRMPEIQVPLASYTGWNLRSPKIGAPDQLVHAWLGPGFRFPLNKTERENRKDPRTSIEERYPSKHDYLEKITGRRSAIGTRRLSCSIETSPTFAIAPRKEWDYVTNAATVRKRNLVLLPSN